MGLPTPYQEYIHLSRYARYRYDENRRETWTETVDRYINFFKEHLQDNLNHKPAPAVVKPVTRLLGTLKQAEKALLRQDISLQRRELHMVRI